MSYVITAKYPGKCECGWEWELGETIYLIGAGKPPMCCGCYQAEQADRVIRMKPLKQRPCYNAWPQENE